jgi:hypothetical protein
MINELVARIVESAFPYKRKSLTRSAAENDVYIAVSYRGTAAQLVAGRLRNALANGRGLREVEFMSGAMDRIDFDGRDYIESGLLETEAKPSRTGKKIDSDRSVHCFSLGR